MFSIRRITLLFACCCGIACLPLAAQESERSFVIQPNQARVSFAPQSVPTPREQLQHVADSFSSQAPFQRPAPIQPATQAVYREEIESPQESSVVSASMGRNDSTVVQTAVVAPVSVASRPILKQTPIEPEASETQPSPAVVESTATFEPEENAPRKKSLLDAPLVHSNSDAKGKIGKPSLSGGIGPIVSIFVSLFIVITTFLLLAMLFKKVSPKGIRALPKELFENLGRAPLTQKHQLNLLRLGNRLLLVSVTLDGVQPITEITDPDEVVQLLGLCRRQDANSSTQNFKKMFSNLAEEPAEGGYFGADVETRPKPKVKTVPKTKASLVDLYSDPDESLTELLANGLKGGRNG